MLKRCMSSISHNVEIIEKTPLQLNQRLSNRFNCNLYLKREDLQRVRSFKIRGAFNKINNLNKSDKSHGVVCASAGNHAQGVALSCSYLNISSDIFIPVSTPAQKVNRIKSFGNGNCNVHLFGDSFDECLKESLKFSSDTGKQFIHPYDDMETIIGQGTIANEIYQDIKPDVIIGTIGGGGLMSGISLISKEKNNDCLLYGAEPDTCPSMKLSINENKRIEYPVNDFFVDGATVSLIGEITFNICKENLDDIYVSPIGKICETMLELYQEDGIVSEPAGAIPISVLDQITDIENKNVVCILSGGNNDITKYPEVIDRYLRYQGLKHYYIVKFVQKPGELKSFINNVLGPDDDIIRFEYMKKTNREFGNVLIGVQLTNKDDIENLDNNFNDYKFEFIKINENDLLYSYLI